MEIVFLQTIKSLAITTVLNYETRAEAMVCNF